MMRTGIGERRVVAVAAMLVLGASVARAVIDPQPDGIGVYFDTEANSNHITVDVPEGEYIYMYAYIIVTNPTFLHFSGCMYGYRITAPEESLSDFVYNVTGAPGMVCPCDIFETGTLTGFVSAGFHDPAVSDATEVGRFFIVLYANLEVEFYIKSLPEVDAPPWYGGDVLPTPGIEVEGEFIPLHISSGSSNLPVASINTEMAPVTAEGASWGAVKVLFR